MRLYDWNATTVAKYKAAWDVVRQKTGEAAYDALAQILTPPGGPQVSPELLKSLAGSRNRENLYSAFTIPKKRGGTRTILAPAPKLKWVQRSILQLFTHVAPRHRCAKGFERGQSIVTHAQTHAHKKWLLVFDIVDFFPSISWGRIFGLLQAFPFHASADVARILANIASHNGHLPQGAPSSPVIANIVCRRLDSNLLGWARSHGYTYTRYADDLVFSTNRTRLLDGHINEITEIISSQGFRVNQEKQRTIPRRSRQIITGLVVNSRRANIKREEVRNIKALLHNVDRFGWSSQIHRKISTSARGNKGAAVSSEGTQTNAPSNAHTLRRPLVSGNAHTHLDKFQSVIRGKISFIGHVRGRQDRLYLRLKNSFDWLCLREHTSEYQKSRQPENLEKARLYSQFKQEVETLQNIEEPQRSNSMRQFLSSYPSIPDFSWIYKGSTDFLRVKKLAKRAYYGWLLTAKDTANFFRYFDQEEFFKGLLHSPAVGNVPYRKMLINCKNTLNYYRLNLPNLLKRNMKGFLDSCALYARKYPGTHLWKVDEFREQIIIPFKGQTRLDLSRGRDSTHLDDMLQEIAREAGANESNQNLSFIVACEDLRPIYTDVMQLRLGLKCIVESMANNCVGRTISIVGNLQKKLDQNWDGYQIVISDAQGKIVRQPKIESIFNGKLRSALKYLRGLVEWTLSAEFSSGSTYNFDVMRNERHDGGLLLPDQSVMNGVVHRITLLLPADEY